MSQLLLINPKVKPSKRKGVGKMAKRKWGSPAQKRALAKMLSANRHAHGGVKAKKRRRASNPVVSVRRKGKAVSKKTWKASGYSRNPIVKRHKRRRNPIMSKLGLGGIMNQVTSAAIAAGGAVSLDLIWGYLPIPVVVKVGPLRHVAKAVGAIGLGMIAGMVVKRETANSLALGALTVVMYNAAREALANVAPNIALGEYMVIDQPGLGEYMNGITDESGAVDGIMDNSNTYDMQGIDSGSEF